MRSARKKHRQRGADEFHVDNRPILLCEPVWRRGSAGDLELRAVMETARLKAARTETMKKVSSDYFALYVGPFDPAAVVEGQNCRLEMRVLKEFGPRGGVPAPVSKPGSRERQLGLAREKVGRKLGYTYLFAIIASKTLTHLLRELTDSASGTLEHVAVIIRPMPKPRRPQVRSTVVWPPPNDEDYLYASPPREPQPRWAILLAIPEDLAAPKGKKPRSLRASRANRR